MHFCYTLPAVRVEIFRICVTCGEYEDEVEMERKREIKPDVILKNFWRRNERFADLFNAVLFGGEQIVEPGCLQERDTDMSSLLEWKEEAKTLERIRDVVKKNAYGVDFAILGIENQMKVHYAMPLRVMIYDSLAYLKECNEVIKRNQEAKQPMKREEFLSGIRKEDRIHPVITIVLYYNEKPWDGPYSIRDMMKIPESLKTVIQDYGMYLVQVSESDKYVFRNSDVATVFEVSREIFRKNFVKLETLYSNKRITSEQGLVIGAITESDDLIRQALEQKGRDMNMCSALEELKNKGREEGREEAREEGIAALIEACQEFARSREETRNKVMEKFSLDQEKAQALLDKYWR